MSFSKVACNSSTSTRCQCGSTLLSHNVSVGLYNMAHCLAGSLWVLWNLRMHPSASSLKWGWWMTTAFQTHSTGWWVSPLKPTLKLFLEVILLSSGVPTLHSAGWVHTALHGSCILRRSVPNLLSIWVSDWGFYLDCVKLTLLWGQPHAGTTAPQQSQMRALPPSVLLYPQLKPPLYNHSGGEK